MKRIRYILIFILNALIILPFIFKFEHENITVKIEKGQTLGEISKRLGEEKVIQDAIGFRLLTRLEGKTQKLSYGWYNFQMYQNARRVLNKIYRGQRMTVRVTIPEGFRCDQVVKLLEKKTELNTQAIDSLLHSEKFLRELGIPSSSCEGYLFPDTYIFYRMEDAESVIKKMVSRLFSIIEPGTIHSVDSLKLTTHQILTIASLIEKEAMIEREKPKIASVIYNRLKRGMRLQIDASVLYALNEYKSRVYYKDLRVNSPYNTYRNHGLPPGPIANPGYQSILAALHPLNTEFYYYVATGNGDHIFTKTYSEHIKAKREMKPNW